MIRLTNPDQVSGALQFMRQLAGHSQRKLASMTGFSQAQIGGWEVHERSPNISSLIRLADALGYDLALIPREDDVWSQEELDAAKARAHDKAEAFREVCD